VSDSRRLAPALYAVVGAGFTAAVLLGWDRASAAGLGVGVFALVVCGWHLRAAGRRAAAERQDRLVRDARLEGLESRVNEIELVVRCDGTIVHANDRALAAYGYAREELAELDVRDLREPETRHVVPAQLAQVAALGETRFESVHVRKDGTRFPVEVSSRTFDVNGETLVHSLVLDLTEQRQREEQLRVNAALVSQMQEAVITTGLDLRVRSWSGAAEAIYGFTAGEAIGRDVASLVQPELPASDAVGFAAGLARAGAVRVLARQRRKDGSPIYVDASTAALRAPDGSVSGYLAVVRDVTEQRHAERKLRRSEERLRLALAAGAHVAWEWDVEHDVFTHGPGWPEMLGARPDAVPDTIDGWRGVVHPEDLAMAWADLNDCVEGRTEEYRAKYRVRTASGQLRWIRSQARATRRDGTGRALRLVGTRTDITETEELNRRLLEATRLASVGTLASGVAHEINNPLAYVSANVDHALDLLAARGSRLDEATAGELHALLTDAREGSQRIAAIVRAMRSLGRPDRPDPASDVDVRGELLSAIQMVRNQLVQRAALQIELPESLPRVRSRSSELGRVFLNLLVNAAQALPGSASQEHRIEVRGRAVDGSVVVEVGDSGCGLTDEVRARMFDAFFTTKPVGEGTGLGLTIAKSIVDAAGGRIEVEARKPRGTVFRVVLPASRASAASPAGAPRATVDPARRRVMVVDDEPGVRRSLVRMLTRQHEVVAAESGEDALRLIARDPAWDAILCDLMMSGMDGIALHGALASRHPALLRRLAFVTGGVFGERVTAFLAEHPVIVVPKPFEASLLLEVIQRLGSA
jgi:PAS domain S-box-containing protein